MTEQEANALAEKIAGEAEIEMLSARACDNSVVSCARTHAAQVKLRSDIADALLSAFPGVEVRPLEWELNESGLKGQRAETPVGRYSVWPCPDNGSWAVRSDAMGMHIEPNESAAKLAADQHYRARIGLALRPLT